MIIFAIPLRAKATTRDWASVSRRFNATIQSVFNQYDSDEYMCIVACNDIPKLEKSYDQRLEFIQLDLPIPNSWIEMARDMFWKLTEIAVRCREILEQQEQPEKGIYVMPLDADDLVSNRIAKWCESHPNENGFVSKDGYVWENHQKYMTVCPEMHTYCGSCNIIKMFRNDLPAELPADRFFCHDRDTASVLNMRYPIRWDHNTVVQRYMELGRTFSVLPFRSTIYVREDDENISKLAAREKEKLSNKRFHPRAFLRSLNVFQYRLMTLKIINEFGIKV